MMDNITNSQKIFEVSEIWKEAAYNFVYWDKLNLNWDEEYKKELKKILETKDVYEYYRELSRFITLLNDGHTGVTFPMELYQNPEYFSMMPVILNKFGEEIAVINTTEELKDSVPMYSVLKKIDGIDAQVYIRETCYPYFWHGNEAACSLPAMNEILFGRNGSKNTFTFEKDGKTFDVTLERSEPSKLKWVKTDYSIKPDSSIKIISSSKSYVVYLKDDVAVIKIMTFADDSVPGKIYECFEELKNAKGYIVDVRGNGGGNSSNADAVAALFIKENFKSCFAETQVYEPTIKAWSLFREDFKGLSLNEAKEKYAGDSDSIKSYRIGRNMFYVRDNGDQVKASAPGKLEGPVVVLMNENSVSAAEDFVDVMKMYTDAVFVGNNTAGTSGQPLFENLESGGSFRICTRRCIAQNGEDIYNKGFAPDVKITQSLKDFIDGVDAVMEKGLEVLKSRIN